MTATRTPSLLRMALALALVGGGAAVATDWQPWMPRWAVAVQWTGEGDNPAAIAWSVGPHPLHSRTRDVNEVGRRGRWARSGTAKSGDHIVVSAMPTNTRALGRCVLSIDDRVVDTDPPAGDPDGAIAGGVLCQGTVP